MPFVGYACYTPSKAATRAFVDVLRNEFADRPDVHLHLSFPPDTETPGFEKENETKPLECKNIARIVDTKILGQELVVDLQESFKPDVIAASIVEGVMSDRYHLKSADVVGELFVSRGWGHYPRSQAGILWFTLETFVLAPFFMIVQELFVLHTDALVRRYDHHGRGKGASKASKGDASPKKFKKVD